MKTIEAFNWRQVVEEAKRKWIIMPSERAIAQFVDRCVRRGLVSFAPPLSQDELRGELVKKGSGHARA
jgi:hypothetical protein